MSPPSPPSSASSSGPKTKSSCLISTLQRFHQPSRRSKAYTTFRLSIVSQQPLQSTFVGFLTLRAENSELTVEVGKLGRDEGTMGNVRSWMGFVEMPGSEVGVLLADSISNAADGIGVPGQPRIVQAWTEQQPRKFKPSLVQTYHCLPGQQKVVVSSQLRYIPRKDGIPRS